MKANIRMAVLNNEAAEIRELLLTESQVSFLRHIVDEELFTSEKLSQDMNASIQCASGRLSRLYRGGYLDRVDRTAESGGIEFIYSVPIILRGSF